MHKTKKILLISAISLLAVWLAVSLIWFAWSRITFSQYTDGMTENPYSNFIVRRYAVSDSTYTYFVKYPDYLSPVGNLAVSVIDDTANVQAFLIWYHFWEKPQYGLIIADGEDGYQIYTDENGNPLDTQFQPITDKYTEEISAIIQAAGNIWTLS